MTTAANYTLEQARAQASDPAKNAIAFDGNADVTLDTVSRGIYIASDGSLTVDMLGDGKTAGATNITFAGLKAGTVLPICVTKIYDTGTDVSGVVLL